MRTYEPTLIQKSCSSNSMSCNSISLGMPCQKLKDTSDFLRSGWGTRTDEEIEPDTGDHKKLVVRSELRHTHWSTFRNQYDEPIRGEMTTFLRNEIHVFYRNLAICLLWPLIDDTDSTVARYVEIEVFCNQSYINCKWFTVWGITRDRIVCHGTNLCEIAYPSL